MSHPIPEPSPIISITDLMFGLTLCLLLLSLAMRWVVRRLRIRP